MQRGIFAYLVFLVLLMSIFSIGMNVYLLRSLELPSVVSTGQVSSTATVSLTQAGSAGINLEDAGVVFGSGYYNSSICSLGYGLLNSNTSRACWSNTTAYISSEDVHHLTNSGTVPINVTVSSVNLSDAEELFCGSSLGCTSTAGAGILVQSLDNESSSCSGLTTAFENITTATGNATVGVCDVMGYTDGNDSIQIYVELHIPSDATTGNKTLYLNYEAVAL